MKKLLISVLVFVSLLAVGAIRGDDPKEPERKPVLMRKKLELSQKILAGLVNEDFNEIEKNAKIMNTFVHLEQWMNAKRPGYVAQLNIFHLANDELIRLAGEKNLEGSSLAYMQLTLSCVNCHKVIRDPAK